MSFKTFLSSILFLSLGWTLTAQASSVSAQKGKRVVITMDTDFYQTGDVVYGMTGSKKTALIQIQKVKGNKALGVITKGHVAVGGATMPRVKSARGQQQSARHENSSLVRNRKKLAAGFLVGYAMQSATATVQGSGVSEGAKFTGNALSLKAFADYDYTPQITIRGALGLEPLQTKATLGQSLCSSGTTNQCKFSYNFIALEAAVHYNIVTQPTRYWIGLGYSYLSSGGNSNNTPNLKLAGNSTQMVLIGAGADFNWRSGFIPVVLEYGIFPSGGGVTVTSIFLRTGYGWSF
jgi:hypothetical protein